MRYLLNLAYLLLLLAASPWLAYRALRSGKYREGFAAKFFGRVPRREGDGPCIWLHAVSVGEVNLLAPLLAELVRRRPDCTYVISSTSRTGYALARKKYAGQTVFHCPLDFSWAVAAAMRRIRPSLLILAELELWPNLIDAVKRHGAAVAVVNGRLSAKSFAGYCRIRPLVASVLRQLDLAAAQNDEYAERFRALGVRPEALHVTGSLKFDGAQTDRNNAATCRLRQLAGFADDDLVFLAGSTQSPEEQLALDAFRQLAPQYPRLRLILVPRHPERFAEAAALLDAAQVPWQRRSLLTENSSAGSPRILLVDAVGELGAWWGTAQIAFVGGSLGTRGGQNMIEPAAYGAAVSFGPNTVNFRDVVAQFLAHDAAVVIHDGAELTAFVRRCLTEPPWAEQLGARARELVQSQTGATRVTVDHLVALLPTAQSLPRGLQPAEPIAASAANLRGQTSPAQAKTP